MRHPVKTVSWATLLSVLLIAQAARATNPCAGRGTKIFFVNGLFNDKKDARNKLREFKTNTEGSLSSVKNLDYELAWAPNAWGPVQLAQAVADRGVDDFEHYPPMSGQMSPRES